jgi:hypothetical protein
MDFLSPAQVVGYVAFAFGVAAFSQKIDRRLKLLNGAQCVAYAIHFVLLGNVPASAISTVAAARSFLALRFSSPLLAGAIVAVNLAIGAHVATSWAGWLPVVASSLGTVAFVMMRGIPMRAVMLVCCLMWLANNILSGSIGGTMLETAIAFAMVSTIFRMTQTPAPGA